MTMKTEWCYISMNDNDNGWCFTNCLWRHYSYCCCWKNRDPRHLNVILVTWTKRALLHLLFLVISHQQEEPLLILLTSPPLNGVFSAWVRLLCCVSHLLLTLLCKCIVLVVLIWDWGTPRGCSQEVQQQWKQECCPSSKKNKALVLAAIIRFNCLVALSLKLLAEV